MSGILITMAIVSTLKINILWSETPWTECGRPRDTVNGCSFDGTRNIVISFKDSVWTTNHEIGHNSGIDRDEEVRKVLANYPALRPASLWDKAYAGVEPEERAELNLREKGADWFAYYMESKSWNSPEAFKQDYPDIAAVFDKKIEEILNKK